MSDLVVKTNVNSDAVVDLTDQLIEIFKYYTEKNKEFTKKEILEHLEKYGEDLKLTKDQLKELIKALDGIDFVQDGKIDVKVLVGKIAKIEAIANTNNDELKAIKEIINENKEEVNKIKTFVSNIAELNIDNVQDEIKEIKNKISELDKKIDIHEKAIKSLQIDMKKVKMFLGNFF